MFRYQRLFAGAMVLGLAVQFCPAQQQKNPAKAAKSSPEALAAYSDAASYQNNKAFDLASEEWQKFLKKFPDDPKAVEARYNLAICHLQAEEFSAAIDQLKQVVGAKKEFDRLEDAHLNLGWAQYSLALNQGKPDLFDQAASSFATLLDEFPKGDHADQALFFRGESLYMQGKREEAVASYRELVQQQLESKLRPDAMYALGVAYEDLRKFSQAGQLYDSFLKEFADHELTTEIRMRKAETVLQEGQFEKAEKMFADVAAAEGFRAVDHARFRQAFCISRQGRYKDAADLFADIVESSPKSAYASDAAIAAGRAYYRAKELEEADKWFQHVVESDSRYAPEAIHWKARILLDRGQPKEARQLVADALPTAKEHPYFVNLKLDDADALYELPDRRRDSVAAYLKIAEEHADHPLAPKALYNAAYGSMELGDYQRGLSYAKRFFDKYEKHSLRAEVQKVAAECKLQLGQHDEAAEAFADLAQQSEGDADSAKFQIRRGLTQYLDKEYREAIKTLQIALETAELAEDQAEAHYWIGMCHVGESKFKDGVASFQASLATDPNWRQADEVLLNLSRAMQRIDRLEDAKSTVTKLIATHPKSQVLDQAYFRLAEFCYTSNDYEQAIKHYSRVIDDWKDSKFVPFSLHGRGWSNLRSGQPDLAVADFGRLLTDFPQHDLANEANYGRAMARHQSGDHKSALEDVDRFLATEPDAAEAADGLYVRGLCYAALKDSDAAIETFEGLMQRHPQYAEADKVLYELAWAHKTAKDDKRALAIFQDLIKKVPDSPLTAEAFYHVGESHYGADNYGSAAKAYALAFRRAKKDELREKAAYKLGWAQYQQADYDAALTTFKQQLDIDPDSSLAADAWFMRGECHFKQKHYQEAFDAFTKAQKKLSQNETMRILTYLHGAQSAAQLKQWQTSLQWISLLRNKFPESVYLPQALYEQGWAQKNLGQLESALESFELVTEKSRSEIGARARFMMGEIHFERKNYNEAIQEFRRVMYGYGGNKASRPVQIWQAKSGFEAGRCAGILAGQQRSPQRRAQYVGAAQKFFQYVLERHPRSDEAKAARSQLARLGA